MLNRNYSVAPNGASPSRPPAFLEAGEHDIWRKFTQLDENQALRQDPSAASAAEAARWARETGHEIEKRNRYFNIEPWSANRVKLCVPEGRCDYINASHIELQHSRSGATARFIATQGPKETSRGHFWHMIWDHTADPAVIVMLTQTHENGKEKCSAYFPQDMYEDRVIHVGGSSEGQRLQPGESVTAIDGRFRATVELQSSVYDSSTRSTVRTLKLSSDGKEKTVKHYLYAAWPDFSVPDGADRRALLRLAQITAADAGSGTNDNNGVRVVHCSAGVGRSGSFIALDYLVGELAEGAYDAGQVAPGADPIADTVDKLREQRMMMVQGEAQFFFLYRMLRELWCERHGIAS